MSGEVAALRRVLQPPVRPPAPPRCEICGEPIGAEHGHVAQLVERRLLCSCRGCYLLFTGRGAGGGRMRAVPTRYLAAPPLPPDRWGELAVPVDVVFVFDRGAGRDAATQTVACYPSPAGATEADLGPAQWQRFIGGGPPLPEPEPDVEALLLRRRPDRLECFLVPIDACYELVGLVRSHWVGFAGGAEVWRRIDGFFADVAARCAPAGVRC